jgi:hypothetical protein
MRKTLTVTIILNWYKLRISFFQIVFRKHLNDCDKISNLNRLRLKNRFNCADNRDIDDYKKTEWYTKRPVTTTQAKFDRNTKLMSFSFAFVYQLFVRIRALNVSDIRLNRVVMIGWRRTARNRVLYAKVCAILIERFKSRHYVFEWHLLTLINVFDARLLNLTEKNTSDWHLLSKNAKL